MAFNYEDQQAQEDEMRRQQEELMRQQQEDAARQQAEAAARAQQEQQQQAQGQTLGQLVDRPQAPPQNPYDPQVVQPGAVTTQPRGPAAPLAQPTNAPPPAPGQQPMPGQPPMQPMSGEPQGPASPTPNPYVPGATNYYGGTAFPTGTASPERNASEMDLDQFNQGVRNSELYQQFTRERGIGREGAWGVGKWSDADREAWKRTLADQGVELPSGMKVDDGGNLNQTNRTAKNVLTLAGGYATRGKKEALISAAIIGTVLTGGALAGSIGGAAGAGAAGAGAAGAGAAGAGAAGAAGAGMAGASMMPSVISGIAGLGSTYLGARAQTQAGKQASAAQERASQSSERTITAQMQFEREQRSQDRADAERRWAAEQEMASRMWAAQEDERLYQRKVYEEDRAEAQARRAGGGGGYSGPSGPDPRQQRKEQAQRTLAQLLAQGTPGVGNGYTPATQAGPTGRG